MQKENRKLPPELVETLAPHQRHALEHPIRRQILRTLDRDTSPLTLGGFAEEMPAGLSTISYHLLVLEECGLVSVSGALTGPGEAERSFVSNFADNRAVVAALQAAEPLDALDD